MATFIDEMLEIKELNFSPGMTRLLIAANAMRSKETVEERRQFIESARGALPDNDVKISLMEDLLLRDDADLLYQIPTEELERRLSESRKAA